MQDAAKIWKTLNDGAIGYVFYILMGMVAAVVVTTVLGLALDTNVPLVAVLSGSMDHGLTDETDVKTYPCSKSVPEYRESFESWWTLCDFTYKEFGITREQFLSFPFKDGFKKGDIPVIRNDGVFEVGDIVVYDISSQSIPIIHRVVSKNAEGTFQTKGDHNPGQNSYEKSVQRGQIRGKVIFVIPYLGYLRVLLPIS